MVLLSVLLLFKGFDGFIEVDLEPNVRKDICTIRIELKLRGSLQIALRAFKGTRLCFFG